MNAILEGAKVCLPACDITTTTTSSMTTIQPIQPLIDPTLGIIVIIGLVITVVVLALLSEHHQLKDEKGNKLIIHKGKVYRLIMKEVQVPEIKRDEL